MAQAAAIAASVLQAGASVYGGIEQQAAANRSARAEEENGRRALFQGALDATQGLRESRQMMGADLAAGAEGGAAVGGSIADLIAANSIEAQVSAMSTRYAAGVEDAQHRQRASDLRKQGKAAMIQGIIGGATALVGGAAQARNQVQSDLMAGKMRASSIGGGGKTKLSTPTIAYSPVSDGRRMTRFGGY